MGDNGWMLGEHGFTSKVLPYRPSTHVPFFVVGPELKKDENSGLVLNIDIAPTILELAGIEVPDNMHGKSVVQLLSNDMAQWRNSFIYEGLGNYGGTKPNLTAINNNFRYIETYEDSTLNNVVFRELYNQLEDADEMVNLANIPSSEMLLKKMQEVIRMHKLNILRLPN
jgi:arylsulfatase A-like enzyme